MKAAAFDYHVPESVDAAVALLAELGDEAKVLAGGQSLVPVMAMRLGRPEHIVDVNRIEALAGATRSSGTLRVGALTRHRALETDVLIRDSVPLLARAAPHIGHFQIRNRGTVGGSLAHADSAAELPAVAVALDAEIEVRSTRGSRRIRAADFFVSIFMTALEPDELVTAVHLPVWGRGCGFAVAEFARRHGDFALAGAACGVQVDGGRIVRAAVGLIGMGSVPVRAWLAEQALTGAGAHEVDLASIGRDAVAALDPPSDAHGSAAYRRHLGAQMITRALGRALAEAQGQERNPGQSQAQAEAGGTA
ncbi:xanthine dehydrogenase family protein subunit M [Parafrankia sp. FMc6]|uniref:FAD binding domain-containing protein n=1 Tax=Parafrankia soli TaxID=2599596 RepID=UPI0034D6672A